MTEDQIKLRLDAMCALIGDIRKELEQVKARTYYLPEIADTRGHCPHCGKDLFAPKESEATQASLRASTTGESVDNARGFIGKGGMRDNKGNVQTYPLQMSVTTLPAPPPPDATQKERNKWLDEYTRRWGK